MTRVVNNNPFTWGDAGWGASTAIVLDSALAVRENVVRLAFTEPVYFSRILDVFDASDPSHYAIAPVAGSSDQYAQVPRAVNVIAVEQVTPNSDPPIPFEDNGHYLDLYLDRPMSSYPAAYTVSCADLKNATQTDTLVSAAVDFDAVYRELIPPTLQMAAQLRDIANPQTLDALRQASSDEVGIIGSIVVGDDGDYAFDEGDIGLKKRIVRRTFTKKNGFVHLPGYGIGITSYGKKLARLDTIGKLTTDARIQYAREPDVAKVIVSSDIRRATPDLLRLHIAIRPRGSRSQKFTVSVPIS